MWGREPVAVTAAIRAVLVAAMSFGWDLSDEQFVAVMVALETVLALVTRARVSPAE